MDENKKKKVITALECCKSGAECDHCPYSDENVESDFEGCYQMHWDAQELLEEQQAEIEQLRNDANARRCKDCKHRDPEDGKCDSGHGIQWQLPRPDDWFCADFDPSDEAVLEAFAEDG